MADFAGFAPGDLAAYFGVSPAQALAIMDLANQSKLSPADLTALGGLPPSRFAPGASGPNDGSGDIAWGLQHLAEHPAGSHYHGDVNIGSLVGNIATGGLYGAAQSAYNLATGKGSVLGDLRAGLNQLGPWGSATYPVSPQLAETGNLIGAGAGLAGGGLGALRPTGFGAAGLGPEGLPILTDAAGNAAMQVAIDPVTGATMPGAGIPASGISGLSAGSAGSGGSALLGAQAGQQAESRLGGLGGGSPQLAAPIGGAYTGTGTGGQQLTPQQRAALLSAMQSEAHKGLAPRFESRQAGQQESPGISSMRNLSGGY